MNTYFPSISTIDDTNVTLPNMHSLCNNNLSNIFIEEQEITDIITILPVNKAIGPDCISHKMLKSTKSSIVKPLKLLFNRSLSENMFPSVWKIAHEIPLFKKVDPSLVSNYRPVSLLSCVSKIMVKRELSSNIYTTIFIVMICFIDIRPAFCRVTLQFTNY